MNYFNGTFNENAETKTDFIAISYLGEFLGLKDNI